MIMGSEHPYRPTKHQMLRSLLFSFFCSRNSFGFRSLLDKLGGGVDDGGILARAHGLCGFDVAPAESSYLIAFLHATVKARSEITCVQKHHISHKHSHAQAMTMSRGLGHPAQ